MGPTRYERAVATASLLLFVSTSCVLSLTADQLDQKLLRVVDNLRAVMPTGFPAVGLPPIDPYEQASFSHHFMAPSFDINFDATNLKVVNQKAFTLKSLKSTTNPLRTAVSAYCPLVVITADHYSMKGTVMSVVPINGQGKIKLILEDVTLSADATVDLSVPAIRDDFRITLNVGKVKSHFTGTEALVNEIMEDQGPVQLAGEVGQEAVNAIVRDYIDLVNRYFVELVKMP